MTTVRFVNWGVGNVIDGEIYINRALEKYPDLLEKVMVHEVKHIRGEKDVDWNETFSWKMLWFCVTHPSTWCQWSPIWIEARYTVTVSKSMAFWWTFVLVWIAFLVLVNLWILR